MRTTVNISDDLLERARAVAVSTHRTLGSVLDDALRVLLIDPHRSSAQVTLTLPVYGGSGLHPGVDLEDRESLADLLDKDEKH